MTEVIRNLNLNLIDAIYLDLSKHSDSDSTQIQTRYGGTNIKSFKVIQKDTLARWGVGRYQIEEAAEFISKYGDVKYELIEKKLKDAINIGDLDTYPTGQNIIREVEKSEIWDDAYWDDLNEWLDKNEKRITWRFEKPSHASQSKQTSINALPIIQAEAIKKLTKQPVINAFENVYWNRDQWNKYLASPPNWLLPCRVAKGTKSVSATWNPVQIGLALMDKKITLKQLDLVFWGLKDWKAEWQEKTELMR